MLSDQKLNLAALSKDIKDARNFLNALTKDKPQWIEEMTKLNRPGIAGDLFV